MSKVTVAAVQMTYGLENAVQRVEEAAAQGAQVILLPELFENWYFCQEKSYENYHLATTLEENPAVNALRTVARDFRVVLPVSYYERVGNTTFNTVAVIDADGTGPRPVPQDAYSGRSFLSGEILFHSGDTGFRVWDTALCQNRRGHLLGPMVSGIRALHGADGRGAAVLSDRDRLRADPGMRFHAALAPLHAGPRGGEHHAAGRGQPHWYGNRDPLARQPEPVVLADVLRLVLHRG